MLVLALSWFTNTRLTDLADLVADGAIVQLREEMRDGGATEARVLVIALDGVGPVEFREAVESGRLPHVARLLGDTTSEDGVYTQGFAPRGVLSILPSTTYAAWTAVYTGEPVGRSGVAGNEWFDRETMTFVAPAPVSVPEHRDALRVYSDALLDDWITPPTVFERADVRSYVTLAAQHRGADLLIRPDPLALGDLVANFTAGVATGDDVDQDKYGALDVSGVENTLEAIERFGLADLQVVYFPGVDLYTHVAEEPLDSQVHYMAEVIDPLIGRLMDAYEERGALDNTYVLFVSDHGHTPSLDAERNALGTGSDDEWPAILEDAGFRLRPFELETSATDFQAVFAYQGAFAYLHLADRSTCPNEGDDCNWRLPPRMEEDVLEAVRLIDRINRTGDIAPGMTGVIDLIFAREPRGIAEGRPFQVWDGQALVPIAQYLSRNPRPDLVDLEERLDALATGRFGHRAGDVLLLSRYRAIDPIEERFYFSKTYRSWHGSPSLQDSEILWVMARRGASGGELQARMEAAIGRRPSQLDFTPLVLDLLGRR